MSESSEHTITPPPPSLAVKNNETNEAPRVLETPDTIQKEIDKTKFARERLERNMEAKRRIRVFKKSQLENSG